MERTEPTPLAVRSTRLTWHLHVRSRQRAIPFAAIEAVLTYGTPRPAGNGACEYYLGRREVEAARRLGIDVSRFERTAVIATAYGTILTVYKADRPTKRREV